MVSQSGGQKEQEQRQSKQVVPKEQSQDILESSVRHIKRDTFIVHALRVALKAGISFTLFINGEVLALPLTLHLAVSEILDQASLYFLKKKPSIKNYVEVFYVLNSVIVISTVAYFANWIFNDYYLIYLIHISSSTLAYGARIGLLSFILSSEAYTLLLFLNHSPMIYYLRLPLLSIIFLRFFIFQKRFEKINELAANVFNIEKTKQDFISIASHNLRTPVAAIYGYIDILLRGDAGSLTQQQRIFIERVKNNNQELEKLTEQLLQISIIEIGREANLLKQPTQIEVIVEDLVEDLRPMATSKGLSIEFQKPKSLLPLVYIDVEKIKGVFLNLIDNSIKYTEKGGITVSAYQKDEYIFVSVRDTGVGISRQDLPKVFSKFFRSGDILMYNKIGVGLGLYLGKQIVERHGGKITVESREGIGSTFTVMLPIISEKDV